MRYEGNIYRPPGEWKSYLLQVTIGCSHNACTFCGMYKDKTFRIRDKAEVLEDIKMAKIAYGDIRRVFLCDGDAIAIPTDDLIEILHALYSAFPSLEKVTTYAGPKSTMRKTSDELRAIHDAGLTRAYLGIETGDGELLLKRGKGVDADKMLEAGLALKDAGFDLWGIIMTGLAGSDVEGSRKSALMTAELINKLKPQHLSEMTYTPVPGTALFDDIQKGKFTVQTPVESMKETRLLIENINMSGLHFTSNHVSNYVPIKGTLSEDREELLGLLDSAIAAAANSAPRPRDYRGL